MEGTRYHPFTPCAAQVPLTVGFLWKIICIPGGPRGVALQLKSPWSWAYPDSFGFMRYFWSKFSVRLACGRSRHRICSKKSLWVLAYLAMKCSLKVQMARSAKFLQWKWGENNCNFSFTSLIIFLLNCDIYCPECVG